MLRDRPRPLRWALTWLSLVLPGLAGATSGALAPKPQSNDNWSESFTFVADVEEGTYVWAQLSFTNLGPGSRHGACRVLVVRPGMPVFSASARVKSSGWSYAAEPERLEVGPGKCIATGGAAPSVRMILEGRVVELRFSDALKPVVPPGSSLTAAGGHYLSEILLPSGPVEVTLSGKDLGDGQKPRVLRGGGYADHSRSTVTPKKLAKQWVRFRALEESRRTLVLGREAHDGSFGPVYLWESGDDARGLTGGFSLSRTGSSSSPQWRARFPDVGTVRSTELLHRSAPVQELGLLSGLVKAVVGSPVTYTHRAMLEREGQPALPGLLEVTLEED